MLCEARETFKLLQRFPLLLAVRQRNAFGRRENDIMKDNDYTPPDPYAADLAKLRAGRSTPESRFAEQWKGERLRTLAAEHAALDAHIAATPERRVSAAELAKYAPPNQYAAGIRALQESKR